MKTKISPTAIGVFIAGAIVILFGSVLLFGSGKLFRHTKAYLLTFQEPVTGLEVGAPVKLMGVNIGAVTRVNVTVNPTNHAAFINALIEIDRDQVKDVFDGYPFDMDDRSRFETTLQAGGLCGQLDILSLLSGQLYIALDMHPGTRGFQLNQEQVHGYWEIPTIPSGKRELMQALLTSLDNFQQVDLQGTVEDLRGLIRDVRTDLASLQLQQSGINLVDTLARVKTLLDNPQIESALTNLNSALSQINELGNNLNPRINPLLDQVSADLTKSGEALDEAVGALRQLRTQVDPASPLSRELVRTLEEAGTSLRALRQLVEQIERNPNSLITGRKMTEPQP